MAENALNYLPEKAGQGHWPSLFPSWAVTAGDDPCCLITHIGMLQCSHINNRDVVGARGPHFYFLPPAQGKRPHWWAWVGTEQELESVCVFASFLILLLLPPQPTTLFLQPFPPLLFLFHSHYPESPLGSTTMPHRNCQVSATIISLQVLQIPWPQVFNARLSIVSILTAPLRGGWVLLALG